MKDPAAINRFLNELQVRFGDSVNVHVVAAIVSRVVNSQNVDMVQMSERVMTELDELSTFIQNLKKEIGTLRPDEVTEEYLPAATNELDAIVEATAEATHNIMDATEQIESVFGRVESGVEKLLEDATMRIYEACGFQDLTGQRINKVIKALREIEAKVDALVSAFGDEIHRAGGDAAEVEESMAEAMVSDEDLLQGPQLEGQGISQDEIDKLLAELDGN